MLRKKEYQFLFCRNVQSILKSPDLDAKYEKFAGSCSSSTNGNSSSPKTSRKKFLSSRQPANKRKRKTSSKTRSSGVSSQVSTSSNQAQNNSTHSANNRNSETNNLDSGSSEYARNSDNYNPPKEISSKYFVGDIVGDGNFAVVRKCKSKKSRTEFALKIIDKSKCLGKEHMIESEIAILTLVSHPHIIELLEVFDFPDEKYLVTEYVRGGDLFDAIAIGKIRISRHFLL